jgi:tripartite-type tricarboxylate transporter receptor subunit TctC
MQPQFLFRFVAALLLCAIGPALCMAQAGQPFYKGRTITLVVPTSPGGINDLAARLVARHLGRFILGNPTIVVENVPGGAGIIAANRLANTIEKDGLTIAIIQRGTPQVEIEGDPNAKFDPLKLTWLGSLSSYANDAYILVVNSQNPVKSVADLEQPGVRLKIGADTPGSTNLIFAIIAKEVLGLDIDVVRGYDGAGPIVIAMQSGELDGQVIGYNSVRAGQAYLWNNKLVRPLVQFGRQRRLPALPDVPTGRELTKDANALALVEFAELPFFMALPFVAPPDLPPERAAALQNGFMQMVKDQAFLDDAGKIDLDISPIDGEAVRQLIARAAATPKDVIARYNQLVGAQ